MKVQFLDRLESPPVVEAARAMEVNIRQRLHGRKPSRHTERIEYPAPHDRKLLTVPIGGYYIRRFIGKDKLDLCASNRVGKPIGKAFRCRLADYDALLRDRYIRPVIVTAGNGIAVYHVPPLQWHVLKKNLQKGYPKITADMQPRRRPKPVEAVPTKLVDPQALSGQTFHSISDLKRAVEAKTCTK